MLDSCVLFLSLMKELIYVWPIWMLGLRPWPINASLVKFGGSWVWDIFVVLWALTYSSLKFTRIPKSSAKMKTWRDDKEKVGFILCSKFHCTCWWHWWNHCMAISIVVPDGEWDFLLPASAKQRWITVL